MILQYLKDYGNSHIDVLTKSLHEKTGVPEEKIRFRIHKLVSQNKLAYDNKIISINVSTLEQPNLQFDEVFEYGPIKITRKGRIITYESKWRKEDHDKFLQLSEMHLPKLRQSIDQKLKEIENLILTKFDPLDVLAYFSAKNLMVDPETYTESSFEGKQLYPEIIQNIILKNALEDYKIAAPKDDMSQIQILLEGVYKELIMYYGDECMTRRDISDAEKEILFWVLQTFLIGRGDAYPQYYKQISVELFSSINNELKQKGFTIQEYWSTLEEIERQINSNYNDPIKSLLNEYNTFLDFINKDENRKKNPDEILSAYRKSLDSRMNKLKTDIDKISDILRKDACKVQINDEINQKLLDLLAMGFGSNSPWSSPLDKSDVAIKPIIKVGGEYYCFLHVHLIRNSVSIIESQFTNSEKSQIKYSDIKGNFFEEKALKLLKSLTNGDLYSRLSYPKDNEIDAIIVLRDLVLLIEVKGKKKRIIAGVNDVLELTKEDFRAHINEAFEQTKRALRYIQSKEEVEFKDKEGKVSLKLRRDSIKKAYLINVCVENFSKLALDINLVKSWDPELFKGDQNPWVVSVYDLMIINDILAGQSEDFIDYLDQRIEVSRKYELKAIDEIDFFGYFLEHGSLSKGHDLQIVESPLIHGYSEKIDRWYSYLRGEVETAERPVRKRPSHNTL